MICALACMTALLVSTSDELGQNFYERVLRMPKQDKLLNTVKGWLERHKDTDAQCLLSQGADCDYLPEGLHSEYTESLETTRERELRQLGPRKHYPICKLKRNIRRLNTDEHEYRPAYYEEIRCTSTSIDDDTVTNDICSSLGFSCVQWNKTIHLTRRLYTSDCWESRTIVIPAGCECMWPVHLLGDMSVHV